VLIADDHAVVREGIRHVLSAEAGFEVVGEAADGAAAVEQAVALEPDVIVLDLTMPVLSGLEAAARIRERAPVVRILVLSIHDRGEYVQESIRAGAQGYLRKDSSPPELRRAVRVVHEGGSFFSTPVLQNLSTSLHNESEDQERDNRLAELTGREREVLVEIARGKTNKEIARELGIGVRTVESHREALMRKLGLRGVAGLTRFALDAGLLAEAGTRQTRAGEPP
jgi:DNA-binding NarL/FixJ family response regulator